MATIEKEKALDVVRQMVADGQVSQDVAEKYFPELAESDDEKIMKELLAVIDDLILPDEQKERFVAWLEKQGKKGTIGNEKEIPFSEQKPAWSEDDEKQLQHAIKALQWYAGGIDIVDWLKSLKDRVQPQPKQEWSEEDGNMIKHIKEYLNIAIGDLSNKLNCRIVTICNSEYSSMMFEISECISWLEVRLKSLRPQDTLKPSKEQIKVCKEVYADILSAKGFDLGTVNSELNRLEEELKKLRGE